MRSFHGRAARPERGASLVEMALVLPLLLLVLMGIIEFGLAFRDYLTVANMSRAGARVVSQGQADADTDHQAALAIEAAANSVGNGNIVKIVIFKYDPAFSSSQGMDPTCKSQSKLDVCNNIGGAAGTTNELDDPATLWGCNPHSPYLVDYDWCPSSRDYYTGGPTSGPTAPYTHVDTFGNTVSSDTVAGTDKFGVYVEVEHHTITGLFNIGSKMSNTTIMRLEPAH